MSLPHVVDAVPDVFVVRPSEASDHRVDWRLPARRNTVEPSTVGCWIASQTCPARGPKSLRCRSLRQAPLRVYARPPETAVSLSTLFAPSTLASGVEHV